MAGLVVLTGFMGTGKTAVGKRLAERLGMRFVDTDAIIESRQGRSVSAIFADEGEAFFRAREREAIAEVAAMTDTVVATGGGALVDEGNRRKLQEVGRIVCLTADLDTILARTKGDARPLLSAPDRETRIRALLAERAPVYACAELCVDTTEKSVDDVVEIIAAHLAPPRRPETAWKP